MKLFRWILFGLCISAITLLLYWPCLRSPFLFDDFANIVTNPEIQNLTQIFHHLVHRASLGMGQNDPSRPITFLTYACNYAWSGFDSWSYHCVNLLLHIFNTLFVFLISRKIFSKHSSSRPEFPAILTSLLFCIHPIQTEAVSYVSGRSDSLSAFFYLLSFYLAIKALEGKRATLFLSCLSYWFCLWSKPSGIPLPAVLFLYDFLFLCDSSLKNINPRKWIHISFVTMATVYLLIRYFYLGGLGDLVTDPYPKWNRLTYFLTQPFVCIRYLQLLCVPIGQSIDHSIRQVLSLWDLRFLIPLFLLLGLLWGLHLHYKNEREKERIVLFSLGWFFIGLIPTSSIFPIHDVMTERRLYLPGIGIFLFLIALYRFSEPYRRRWTTYILVFTIATLPSLTVVRNEKYKNPILLWQEAVRRYPQNDRARFNLGNYFRREGKKNEAKKEYQEALKINPKGAEIYNNLGLVEADQQDLTNALKHFNRALELNPKLREAHLNLSVLYYSLHDYEKSLAELEWVAKEYPQDLKTQIQARWLKNKLLRIPHQFKTE